MALRVCMWACFAVAALTLAIGGIYGGVAEAVVTAALLLIAGWGVGRGSRAAALAVAALGVVAIEAILLAGFRWQLAAFALLLPMSLWSMRSVFGAENRKRGLGMSMAAVVCSLFAGLVVLQAPLLALAQPYVIPTGSMQPTIRQGEKFLVLRNAFMGKVRRGDLISFRYPVDPKQTFVKRVVGMPGDRIRMDNQQLFVNGEKMVEPYVQHSRSQIVAQQDSFPEMVVPSDSYFVLGDNRDNSLDSRHWGVVPRANLVGRPWLVYQSPAGVHTLGRPKGQGD